MNLVILGILFPTISIYFFQKTSDFRDIQLQRAVTERTKALRSKAAHLGRSISHSGSQAISGYNFTFLQHLTREEVENDPELLGCYFLSSQYPAARPVGFIAQGVELVDTFSVGSKGKKQPSFVDHLNDKEPLQVIYNEWNTIPGAGSYPVLQVIVPVYVGATLWGTVNAAFSLEILQHDIDRIKDEWGSQMHRYKVSFLTMTAFFFILGVGAALLFTRPLITSIYALRDGFERVAGGDLRYKLFLGNKIACKELSVVAGSFNSMTDSLRNSQQQLADYSRSLEEKVDERTRELQETQTELLSQAHEAGMAEMAVGVLHNIGNAITPAKVSATILAQRLRTSPLRTNLAKSLETIPGVIDSATNITVEERQRLKRITELLPASICEEYEQVISELESINDKHFYIENIISLQMHYARLQGKTEQVDVNKVTEDALKMLADPISKRQVQVETIFASIPPVWFEESKLLQIIVNLIKNGYEAMDDNGSSEKKLTLATFQEDGEAANVILSVRDTGCGFDPAEKNKLFSFGYSSKTRGSGFGLHSSANYLIANHGAIEAFSKGVGSGAEFIVRLSTVKEEGVQ